MQLVELLKCTCTFELSGDTCYKMQEGCSLGTSTALIDSVSSPLPICVGWIFVTHKGTSALDKLALKNVKYLSALVLQFQWSGFQYGAQMFVKT